MNAKGLTHKGKPFAKNTVYGILANERYSGIYRHGNEVFTNIYPKIVDDNTFNKVRTIVNNNKFGKKSETITYLLKDKVKCGYCGKSIIGDNGTARKGERKYYYACCGRKKKTTDCHKQAIRKDVLENIVLDCVIESLQKSNDIDKVVKRLMQVQEQRTQSNSVLNFLTREQKQTESSIKNIMNAIENGGTSNTAMKRMRELESKQEELERQILVEKSKTVEQLTEKQMRDFYVQALRLEPRMLINVLVKEITLFDDRIVIQFNTPTTQSPDNSQGFLIYSKTVKLTYGIPFRIELAKYSFDVEIYV